MQINNIDLAVELIDQNPDCEVESASSIYETIPYGEVPQDEFFNAVIRVQTNLELKELFNLLKSIETKVGRNKREKWGPREIDLDILFFNNIIYSDEEISVPHKDLLNRDFVIIPLLEIEPDLVHPAINKKLNEFSIFERTSEKYSSQSIKQNIIRKIPHRVLVK